MKVIAPWISTVAMNLWMVGHFPKKKREGGGHRCTWICGKHSLALHFGNWRARRGSSALRHALKGLPPAPWTKEVHLFQNSAPDPWRLGVGVRSSYISRDCDSSHPKKNTACLWVQIVWSRSTNNVGGHIWSPGVSSCKRSCIFRVHWVRTWDYFMMLDFSTDRLFQ